MTAVLSEQNRKRAARGLRPVAEKVVATTCAECGAAIYEVVGKLLADGRARCLRCVSCVWTDCTAEAVVIGGTCPGCAGREVDAAEAELRAARHYPGSHRHGPRSWAEAEREVRALVAVRDLRGLTEPLARRLEGLCAWDRDAAHAIGALAPLPARTQDAWTALTLF